MEHGPPPVTAVGAILARSSSVDNRLSSTVASQGRLSSADDEQLCDCNQEPDHEQDEPELNHAPTTPHAGLRATGRRAVIVRPLVLQRRHAGARKALGGITAADPNVTDVSGARMRAT